MRTLYNHPMGLYKYLVIFIYSGGIFIKICQKIIKKGPLAENLTGGALLIDVFFGWNVAPRVLGNSQEVTIFVVAGTLFFVPRKTFFPGERSGDPQNWAPGPFYRPQRTPL